MNDNKDIIRAFVIFLKEKDVYEKYKDNLFSQRLPKIYTFHNVFEIKNYFFKHNEPNNFIESAFTWAYTKEGVTFWSKINDEWLKLLNILN